MTNQDNPNLCAGLNYKMTPEQISACLKSLADSMEKEAKDNVRLLDQLSTWATDEQVDRLIKNLDDFQTAIQNLRETILELSSVEVIRGVRWRVMHFLAYGEYPTEDADSTHP